MDTPIPPQQPQDILAQPSQSPTQMPKKSSTLPVLFTAMIALFIVAIGYLGYQNWQLKQQVNRLDKIIQVDNTPYNISSPTPSTDPTASQAPNGDLANRKTYTNEVLGFSFTYPQEINSI